MPKEELELLVYLFAVIRDVESDVLRSAAISHPLRNRCKLPL